MSKDDLLALAERCEKATGPDTILDLEVARLCGKVIPARALPTERAFEFKRYPERSDKAYTASLDAAMSLVPEGFHIAQMGEMRYIASDRPWVVQLDDWQGGEHRFGTRKQGLGKTPALALCAAALRARAQQVKQ